MPVYTDGLAFAAVSMTFIAVCILIHVAEPLQRYYLPVYERTSAIGAFLASHRSNYRMLFVSGRGVTPRPAMNGDVVLGRTPAIDGKPIPLALSADARQHGYLLLFYGPERSYVDARLRDYLKDAQWREFPCLWLSRQPITRWCGAISSAVAVCNHERRPAAKAVEVWTQTQRPGDADTASIQQDCEG